MIWTTTHVVLAFYVGGWVSGTMHCYDYATAHTEKPGARTMVCAMAVGLGWPLIVGWNLWHFARGRA